MEYIPISINRFLCGESAPMDLYLRLADSKFIKVVKNGDEFNKDRLRNYKDKSVDTIFITSVDFPKYVNGCLSLLRKMVDNNRPGSAQDFGLSLQVAETVFMALKVEGVSKDSMEQVLELGEILSDQIKAKPKLGAFVEQLFEMDNAVTRHAIAVTTISLMILHNLRWQLKRNVDAIVVASLLHDITLLPYPEIYSEPEDNWSDDVKKAYADHPFEGAQLLLDSGALGDKRVADIIRNHQELPNGTGFPNGLQGNQIYPMALPLIMADRLGQLLLDPESHLADKGFARAVRYMKSREESFYPESYWKALESWKA